MKNRIVMKLVVGICALAFAIGTAAAQTSISQDLAAFSDAVQTENKSEAAVIGKRLLDADFSNTPFSPGEVRALKVEIADSLFAAKDFAGAVAIMRGVILAEEALVLDLGSSPQASKVREFLIENLRKLANMQQRLGTDGQLEARKSLQRALVLAEEMAGPDEPSIRFILADIVRNDAMIARNDSMLASCPTCRVGDGPPSPDEKRFKKLSKEAQKNDMTSLGGDAARGANFETIRVFYGSTRYDKRHQEPKKAFGIKRTEDGDSPSYGSVVVTLPKSRALGSIPRPGFVDFRGARDGVHIVLKQVDRAEDADAFSSILGRSLDNAPTGEKEAFVFVHGHATNFTGAAMRTAQLAVDLDLRHGGIFYAWPASHGAHDYQRSQNNVDFAVNGLAEVLKLSMSEADDLHIIAHSMGNRVLLGALEQLRDEGLLGSEAVFDQIVWASPDVDASVFARKLRKVQNASRGMTLYASKFDRALALSAFLGGNYPRAGQAPVFPAIARVLPAIDTSVLASRDGDVTNHADYAGGAITDLQAVIWHSLAPGKRCTLRAATNGNERYWQIQKEVPECGGNEFRRAIGAMRLYGDDAVERVKSLLVSLRQSGSSEVASWTEALAIMRKFSE